MRTTTPAKGIRPWRVHVKDIGPNFSYASAERAQAMAERLVSGEFWDGGTRRGLLGGYGHVIVWHSGVDADPEVLLRRWHYVAGEKPVEEVIRRGGSGWQCV